MNPKTKFETTIVKIYGLLDKSTKIGSIRDEILVQICKQVTDNPDL